MNRKEVHEQVIKCLRDLSPDRNDEPITEKTNPLMKLGLDSHDGINLACMLSDKFNCVIPDQVNPLVDDQRNRPRLVGEITDLICKFLAVNKETVDV